VSFPGGRLTADDIEMLWERYSGALALYARRWCRFPEDPVQEAFIDMIRYPKPIHDPVAWLFTTVRRRAISVARSERRRREHHDRAARTRPAWFVESKSTEIDSALLEEQLTQLDPVDRDILIARIWGGCTYDQISNIVGISRSSVHRRYERTLKKLAKRLTLLVSGADHGTAVGERQASPSRFRHEGDNDGERA